MQNTIIKQLSKLPTLNNQFADYLKRLLHIPLDSLSLLGIKNILSTLIGSTCQTRNLLHYRHLQDRSTSEKCLLLMEDVFNKIVKEYPQLLDFIANQFLSHVLQHSSCYVSYSFFYLFITKHIQKMKFKVNCQKLLKIMHKIVSYFQESGQIKFLHEISEQERSNWEGAQKNLQLHLSKKFKPNKLKQSIEQINVSHTKIPPLIIPSLKSINSSRYSAISREERTKGILQLRELASSIGEGFIAVELGCLLAHKRTQQVQEFSDNSDFRNKCLEKIQTDRMLSSRLSNLQGSHSQNRSSFDRQMDETNRKYYKKMLTIHFNIVYLLFQDECTNEVYSVSEIRPFYEAIMDLATVGIVDLLSFQSKPSKELSEEYFSTIRVKLSTISHIINSWSQHCSFVTEKKHLQMLWNRNKKNGPFYYEQELNRKKVNVDNMQEIEVIRFEHMKQHQGKGNKGKKQENKQVDFVILQLSEKLKNLFSVCDMNNARFYKYESNILGILANYLLNSFSNTVKYLTIDQLFPILIMIKRQIIQLSHPLLFSSQGEKQFELNKRFMKKEKGESKAKAGEILYETYPDLFSNFLLVISGLMSNHKHVERLLSAVFIKNVYFMETLQKYVNFIFKKDNYKEIKKVFQFYRCCLEIYNQRKLRNQQSKSIKILFNHLSAYFYPRIGCLAKSLQQKQNLISSSPNYSQSTIEDQYFLHEVLDFIKDIYYYCQDELSQNLLEEQIASFYIKYSLINFIKLYSFLTVNQLVSLQSDSNQLTTKESPHVSYHPNINTVFMIDFIRIITSISINRTYQISKKIKQYRILQFFVRQFELEFEVAQNIEKYIKKVSKIRQVPQKLKQPPLESSGKQKIPTLNLKSDKFKFKTQQATTLLQKSDGKKKNPVIPSLKIPSRSDRSEEKQTKGVLDGLIEEIKEKPKKMEFNLDLNLHLTKLNLQKNNENLLAARSSERNHIYTSERKIRKIYSNKTLHSQAILLVLSLLLNKGLLDPQYCDQFPVSHGKINVLYIIHHHLNEQSNKTVIPILAQLVGKIKPYLCGQRLLKLLSTNFTNLSNYKSWKKISAGAYGVIYGCQTNIEQPKQVAIKEMNFPKSIYQRCVLHDIFTQITCLQNFRLDERITTMYNYGVVNNSYMIVMKKYDCSLRDWIIKHKNDLKNKVPQILRIFLDVLQIILLLHQKSVTHYDIKADNILLLIDTQTENPTKVVLGDFGECRIFDQSKEELDMKSRGTECIKSPEMLTLALHLKKQADNYDRRKKIGTTRASDIWSLGCLFYQLLTGEYLFHRADWVNFYVQVTNSAEDVLNTVCLERLEKYPQCSVFVQFLKVLLVRDPNHRPEIKGVIQKFKDLFGDLKEPPIEMKSTLVIQKDIENMVNKYEEEINQYKNQPEESQESIMNSDHKGKIRGGKFVTSYNNSKCNRFMRIMEDIFFVENINIQDGGYKKIKELKITHIVTTNNHHSLQKFNTLLVNFSAINLAYLAFKLQPKISDLLRQVLLLKGRLLFINDETNYATNLLIYTLSYWFRCSVYQTWCLINTQILLFPTFTSDLLGLSSALRTLNDIEERVEELPKLQCICGSVTLILKQLNRSKKKNDVICRCKKKKLNEYASMNQGSECVTLGCQNYLQLVKKRYSISWQSIKWTSMSHSNLLTPIFHSGKQKQSFRTQILLNSAQPLQNLIECGSCVKTCRVYSCRICEMMMFATTENKEELLIVMNNMLRRIRQGIMIPNAQESFAKKTPALSYYTLTKLHMTKSPEQ